jgi:hypothetical protein
MARMLRENAGLLGLDEKAITRFQEAAQGLTSTDKKTVREALEHIEGGDAFPPSLKKLALAVALPGVLKTVAGGDTEFLDKVKGWANVVSFGDDLVQLVSDSNVLKGVTKTLGNTADGIVGAVELVQGISKLADGNFYGGMGSALSGAGGMIMAFSRLASIVPGGQLAGAVLTIAGAIFGSMEETESRKAEKAAQADGAAFLQGAGIRKDMAVALSNMRESDHRNLGPFIREFSKHLNIPPSVLIEKLSKLDKDDLHVFTDVALNLPMKKDGTFDATITRPFDQPMVVYWDDEYKGPMSFQTLKQFARDRLDLDL